VGGGGGGGGVGGGGGGDDGDNKMYLMTTTGCLLYGVSEHGSSEGMSLKIQAFYAINLPCIRHNKTDAYIFARHN
jgi:hypothetical protein